MKSKVLLSMTIALIMAAVSVFAITQSSTYTSQKPPETGQKFYDDTRNFCYKAANTDLPAIITAVNALTNAVSTSNLTVSANLTVASNVTVSGSIIVNGTAATSTVNTATGYLDGTVLNAGSVSSNKLANGDYGAFTVTSGHSALDASSVSSNTLANGDYGAFTVTSGHSALDSSSVDSSQIANGALDYVHISSDVGSTYNITNQDGLVFNFTNGVLRAIH